MKWETKENRLSKRKTETARNPWSQSGWWVWVSMEEKIFTARAYARAVLGIVILSVRPSVTRVHCDKTKWRTADIFIPHERAATLLLWHQEWLVGDALFPLKFAFKMTHPFEKRRLRHISAYNVSTVRDSKKSSIMTNRKSITGFSTSYRWNAHVTPKSRMGGSKAIVFVLGGIKGTFNRIKSATKFLCVKTSSGKVIVRPFPYLMVHTHWREK